MKYLLYTLAFITDSYLKAGYITFIINGILGILLLLSIKREYKLDSIITAFDFQITKIKRLIPDIAPQLDKEVTAELLDVIERRVTREYHYLE